MDRHIEPWSLRTEAAAFSDDADPPVTPRGDAPRPVVKGATPAAAAPVRPLPSSPQYVKAVLLSIYDELFEHDGYATLKVEIRILRRGQKEVILDAGKQFRFVVDYRPQEPNADQDR